MRFDSAFAGEGEGFAQAFDRRCEQEVSAELDEICRGRLVADDESPLTDRVEQGLATRELRFWACRQNEKLCRGRGLRPAEHRAYDIGLARVPVRLGQPGGER